MKLLAHINPENVTDEIAANFSRRIAVRAVIFDRDGNVAMLAVTRDGYHKLPGGGVEEGEDLHEALARECLEEVGCTITSIKDAGYRFRN